MSAKVSLAVDRNIPFHLPVASHFTDWAFRARNFSFASHYFAIIMDQWTSVSTDQWSWKHTIYVQHETVICIKDEKVSIEIAPEVDVFAACAMALVSFGFLHQPIDYRMVEPHIVKADKVGGRECIKCQGR
jgi:hypothetical protein